MQFQRLEDAPNHNDGYVERQVDEVEESSCENGAVEGVFADGVRLQTRVFGDVKVRELWVVEKKSVRENA